MMRSPWPAATAGVCRVGSQEAFALSERERPDRRHRLVLATGAALKICLGFGSRTENARWPPSSSAA